MKIIVITILSLLLSNKLTGQCISNICFDSLGNCYKNLGIKQWQKKKISSTTYILIYLKDCSGYSTIKVFKKNKFVKRLEYKGDLKPTYITSYSIEIGTGKIIDSSSTLTYKTKLIRHK